MNTNTVTDSFIFMKVGDHAGEPWEKILERKQKEFERTGSIFWGYGGTACHPVQQVRPFALQQQKKNGSIYLMMNFVKSNFGSETLRAKEYSINGVDWQKIPDGVNVTGSRYAIILEEIKPSDLELDMNQFAVGIGPSREKNAADYLKGRTDKACLVHADNPIVGVEPLIRKVDFMAQIQAPFAAMLRY